MFAIDENVDALRKPGIEAFFPRGQLPGSVIFQTQACICEVGGDNVRRRLLFGFGEAKSGVVLAKYGVGFIGVPRGVPYFKREVESGWAESEKIFQKRAIEFESGWELHEDWAEVVTIIQHAGNFQESFQSTFAVAESVNVSDLLIGF